MLLPHPPPQLSSCQLQLACVGWHGPELLITVSNGASDRFRSIPACEKADFMASISEVSSVIPLAYSRLKLSFAPAAMPAPQSDAPVPGLVHVVTPLGFTFQPWLVSSWLAADTLNG